MKEEQNFEESWQQLFEQAAVKPPDRVWENIERELDRKRRNPFLLFFVRPQVLAGSIAAILLLVWGGVSFFQQTDTKDNSPKIVLENKIQNTEKLDESALASNQEKKSELNNINNINNTQNNILKYKENTLASNIGLNAKKVESFDNQNSINSAKKQHEISNNTTLIQNEIDGKSVDNQVVINTNENILTNKNDKKGAIIQDLKTLNTRGYYTYGNRFTMNRDKLAFDIDLIETKENLAMNQSKFYVGLQSGAAPFNPNIQLQAVSAVALVEAQAFAKSSIQTMGNTTMTNTEIRIGTPQNEIKSGFSSNYGFSFGYKLSKNWSVESGLRYLQGNSTLSSNSYTIDATTGLRNIYLAQYLISKSYLSDGAIAVSPAPLPSLPNTVISDVGSLNNSYEYLSIPLQAGYTLLPNNRLNFSVLGGFATDVFLKNVIADNNNLIAKTIFTTSNNVYKSLNISGLGGIRGNYLIDKHWQAVLGGSYQQALSSGLQSSTDLQMKLQLFGMQAGINYRF